MPTPFQYDQLEDAIAARLNTYMSSIAIANVLPESDKGIQDAVKAAIAADKALLLVAYAGSDAGNFSSLSFVKQDEAVSLLVNIRFNKLRGSKGIYSQINLVTNYLVGYKTSYGNRLSLKSIELDERNEDTSVFSYNVIFQMSKQIVQNFEDGDDNTEDAATLLKLTYKKDGVTVAETESQIPIPPPEV
jgi:hypothetical protein